jgi:hypothetical protein
MLRKTLLVFTAAVISLSALAGCKKRSEPEPQPQQVKTKAQHEADAENEITKQNMETELERLEKEIQDEINRGG